MTKKELRNIIDKDWQERKEEREQVRQKKIKRTQDWKLRETKIALGLLDASKIKRQKHYTGAPLHGCPPPPQV